MSISKPLVSVVLGSLNRVQFIPQTITTVRNELKDSMYEIIVIDGGSTDGSLDYLLRQKDIITIVQHNKLKQKSWGYFMNLGFKAAQGKYICLISDDCLVVPGAIKNGIKKFSSKVGAAAFYWRNFPDEKKYHVDFTLGGKLFVNHGLFLKKALEKVGYIDEDSYSFYHADGDLCLKLWDQGYKVVSSEKSFIEHFRKHSKSKTQTADWANYLKKWPDYAKKGHDGIKYKSFTDKTRTYTLFPNAGVVKFHYEASSWLRRKLPARLH